MIVTCPDCHHSRLLRSTMAGFRTCDLIPTYKYVDEGCPNCLKPEPIKSPQRFMVSAQPSAPLDGWMSKESRDRATKAYREGDINGSPSALQAPEGAPRTSNVNHEGQTLAFDAKGFPDLEFLDAPEA